MSRKRMVTYDQLAVDVQASHDLTPADRREVLLFVRKMRQSAQDHINSIIPDHLKQHINIKVT